MTTLADIKKLRLSDIKEMTIGELVTIQEIADQKKHRWVVLTDLIADEEGIKGGIIRHIEFAIDEAGKKAAELNLKGIPALLVCGDIEELSVGGIFVK